MPDFDEQETEFARLVSRASFDDSPRAPHGDGLRERAIARFDASAVDSPWKTTFHGARTLMRRPLVRFGALAAACLMVGVVWLLFPGQQSTAEAFNAFATALVEARSATFQIEVSVEGQPKRKLKGYYLAPARFRQEIDKIVSIADMRSERFVTIVPAMKQVTVMNMKGRPPQNGPIDLFEQMRDLLAKTRAAGEQQYQPLGEKQIAGRRALGFRCESPLMTMTLWGDPATGLPIEIDSTLSVPATHVTMSDFDLNVELKESLFDATPPAGYTVRSFDVDASQFVEADLVKTFEVCANLSGGAFPEALNTATVNQMMVKSVTGRGGKKASKEDMQDLMTKSMAIGRGFVFVSMLPASSDAHYAGKGVKRDTVDAPIFWYKPTGKQSYRVIYADLSIRESEQAPQVPGAVRIEKLRASPPPTDDK